MDLNRRWRFDAGVAAEFDAHARQNIPAYEQVVELSLDVVRAWCRHDDSVVEVGCATGYTLARLEAAGYTRLLGVDSSPAMLERCRVRSARLVCSDSLPDVQAPYKAALVNWTLHFVPPAARLDYLKRLRGLMAADGVLVLTDKTEQSPFIESLYHGFKRKQGVPDDDIAAKKRSLVGVLETLPHDWYPQALSQCGLSCEVLWAQYGFVTYLAYPTGSGHLPDHATP